MTWDLPDNQFDATTLVVWSKNSPDKGVGNCIRLLPGGYNDLAGEKAKLLNWLIIQQTKVDGKNQVVIRLPAKGGSVDSVEQVRWVPHLWKTWTDYPKA